VTDRGLQQGLGRSKRLRKRSGFLAVQQRGQRFASRNLVLYAMPPTDGKSASDARLGITVSKKVGNAVVRNRVKRWVRESYRRLAEPPPKGIDLVVIAKPSAAKASYGATAEELRRLVLCVAGPCDRR
jgi:ribonuclease P protein component